MAQLVWRLAARVGRLYCRWAPTTRGKFFVWKRLFRARLAPRDLTLSAQTSFGGQFSLNLRDWVQCSVYAFGEWEPVTTSYMRDRLEPGDVFIDVGANIGYFSILAGIKVGPTGLVHAIEASPSTFRLLNTNLSMNELSNVRTYNVAAADKSGEITLWVREKENIGRSTIIEAEGGSGTVEGKVLCLPLSDILPEDDIVRARFIKIDVEGAEWPVIQGFKHLLPRLSSKTEIILEIGQETVERCLKIFCDAGFEPWVIDLELNYPFYTPQSAGVGIKPLTDEIDRNKLVDLLFRRPQDLNPLSTKVQHQ